ncbi:MAG: alkaline phosphatase family protein [Acidobacteriota bacterium]
MIRSCLLLLALAASTLLAQPPRRTQSVVILMTDGLRWQEVFSGADAALMNRKAGGVADEASLRKQFWRATPEERRAALLPFFWSVAARQGQVFGDRSRRSEARVANGLNFSYPGYSETFCGVADPRIDSNDKRYNPNTNVLEFLHRRPGFEGRVAAFGAWDLFPWILNAPRAGILVNAGYEPLQLLESSPRIDLLNTLKAETEYWDSEAFDAFTFHTALEYLRAKKPRVLAVLLGETDEWAHAGRYDLYLKSARRVDEYVRQLWEALQSMPEYRGSATLILATDHGRGSGKKRWRSHGRRVPESQYVWMAFLGPDTRPLGVRESTGSVTQAQLAATIAAFLGEDFRSAVPAAAAPIQDVLPQ